MIRVSLAELSGQSCLALVGRRPFGLMSLVHVDLCSIQLLLYLSDLVSDLRCSASALLRRLRSCAINCASMVFISGAGSAEGVSQPEAFTHDS
jgi:hypothetical protein